MKFIWSQTAKINESISCLAIFSAFHLLLFVSEHVPPKILDERKRFCAQNTFVRLLSRMCELVLLQISRCGEALAAFIAIVLLLHPVGEHVLIQISKQAK